MIYTPDYWQGDRHQPFEVCKLVGGEYQLKIGDLYWMPEVGLAFGHSNSTSVAVGQGAQDLQ